MHRSGRVLPCTVPFCLRGPVSKIQKIRELTLSQKWTLPKTLSTHENHSLRITHSPWLLVDREWHSPNTCPPSWSNVSKSHLPWTHCSPDSVLALDFAFLFSPSCLSRPLSPLSPAYQRNHCLSFRPKPPSFLTSHALIFSSSLPLSLSLSLPLSPSLSLPLSLSLFSPLSSLYLSLESQSRV